MKKWILRSLLAVALAAALALPAAAEEFSGSDNWHVSFNGEAMESNFKTAQMDEAITALQPGDTVDFTLSLRNDSSFTTDWYMTNKVLKSLEDSQSVADGGAYTYVLTYTNAAGTVDTLYSSDSIGGEKNNTDDLEGLHEATDSLKDYFFLDELASGQGGTVDLKVALEGETQGNIYQDTLAALQMNFAVETVSVTPPQGPTPTPGTTTPTVTPKPGKRIVYVSSIPQTGDTAPIMATAVICGISGLALLALAVLKMLRDSKKGAKR